MKKLLLPFLVLSSACSTAQNTGIGTGSPAMKLHIAAADSALLVLDNSQPLTAGVKSALYFKTGTYYSGGLASIGTATNAARMSLFGFAAGSPSGLREHLTVTDPGFVGIGVTNPTFSFQVKRTPVAEGTARFDGSSLNSMFNYGTAEATYIRGGKAGAPVYINDFGTGDVHIADGGGDVNLVNGLGTVNIGLFGNVGGTPLVINGNLKMTGGDPAAGKVLTSDAAGNASWQDSKSPVGFKMNVRATISGIPPGNYDVGGNYVGEFNDIPGFNDVNGVFTVPVAGVYQFNARAAWSFVSHPGTIAYSIILRRVRAGVTHNTVNLVEVPTSHAYPTSVELNSIQKCQVGDQFYITVSHGYTGGSTIFFLQETNSTAGSFFSGIKLY